MKRSILAVTLLLLTHAAIASGGGFSIPWSLDPYGGTPAEQDAFYLGNTGILMGRAPWSRLFAAWRMLHGLPVGSQAGKTLAEPCCDTPLEASNAAIKQWIQVRSMVPDVKPVRDFEISVFRAVGDFYYVPTCFPDAFLTAAQTLTSRITSFGAADPWVKIWVEGQDQVFTACSAAAELPPLDPAAPEWLKADRAYQEAALALYLRHFQVAEQKFQAIAADASSPWQKLAPYLAARAAVTAALPTHQQAAFSQAREALSALSPPDAFGHSDLARLSGALDFREHPDARRAELAVRLTAATLSSNVAADFKDARRLGQSPVGQPAFLDWIAVFGRIPDKPEAIWFDHYDADQIWHSDAETLAHARAQWQTNQDPAWLIAAMEWSSPGPDAVDLAQAAGDIPADHPAFLTALYHRVRLAAFSSTQAAPGALDAPAARDALDQALSRTDLSRTTRNLLIAERSMLARDISEFARFAPRESPCLTEVDGDKGCVVTDFGLEFPGYSEQRPDIRFGEEAAAIIDRMPVQDRANLADIATLPIPLRLDVALTSWVRAALAQDFATADHLAASLRKLLPQMEPEWHTYLTARPGEDKRFAAWFILAKLPGADVDLRGTYTRPQGTVAAFEGHWHDWLYARENAAPVPPPPVTADLVCFGLCGPGQFALHLPAFVEAAASRAAQERGRFQPADARTAGSVWEDVLAYARAHPADPRSPEALYWLVRISRYGTGHNRSSFRAFVLLHKRYPTSQWATASRYFYD